MHQVFHFSNLQAASRRLLLLPCVQSMEPMESMESMEVVRLAKVLVGPLVNADRRSRPGSCPYFDVTPLGRFGACAALPGAGGEAGGGEKEEETEEEEGGGCRIIGSIAFRNYYAAELTIKQQQEQEETKVKMTNAWLEYAKAGEHQIR